MSSEGLRSVLHVAFPAHGGVARVVSDLVTAQEKHGLAVAVASPQGPLTRWLDGRATHLRWDARRSPGASVVAEMLRLRRLIQQVRPDIVHLHSSKAGLAGRLGLHGTLPTVFQPHAWSFLAANGHVADAARAWERGAARWVDVLVHVSDAERRQGELAGIAPRRWAHIANGVDLAQFRPSDRAAARARVGLGDGPLAVCAGRICRQKGQDLLVELWPRVTAVLPDAQLALVGRSEEPLPPLPAGVTLRPERDDPTDWYSAADVLAMPSRWEAGLPLVAREAMACARSVLASDLDVVREDFPAGSGALLATDDAAAWTEALVARLGDRQRADQEGSAGRAHAVQHFDIARVAHNVIAVYEQALAARSQ